MVQLGSITRSIIYTDRKFIETRIFAFLISLFGMRAVLFARADLALVHAEVVGEFVPDGVSDHVTHIHVVFPRCPLDRFLIQSYCVGHGARIPVSFTSLGEWNAVIETEQGLIGPEILLPTDLCRRLVFDKKRDILYLLPH